VEFDGTLHDQSTDNPWRPTMWEYVCECIDHFISLFPTLPHASPPWVIAIHAAPLHFMAFHPTPPLFIVFNMVLNELCRFLSTESLHKIPQNMSKPKPQRQCHCEVCQGNLVPNSTWYRHNPGDRKKRSLLLLKEVTEAILQQPKTNVLPPSSARKRRLDEDVEAAQHASKRTAGSSSVRLMSYMRIYAPQTCTTDGNIYSECWLQRRARW
jgi:hypothetical protein